MILTPNIGFKSVRGKSKQGAAPSYEPETTAYMNAISVPEDDTTTIYGKTGSEIWNLFNDCILIAKNAGVWQNIYTWHPMFGDDVAQLKYNAIDTSLWEKEFFGSWVFNEMGNQTNGLNTYATSQFAPTENNMLIDDCGFTICVNSNIPVGSNHTVSMGCRGGNDGSVIISSKRYTDEYRVRINDEIITTTNTSAGINTSSRKSGLFKQWKNNNIINSISVSGGVLPNTPVYYGAYLNIIGEPILYEIQRLTSECIHKGDDATVSIVHQMIDMWESGLGRKTW